MVASMIAQECIWLKRLIGDIFGIVDYIVEVECDNESTVKLALNLVFHARIKHIEVRYYYIERKC